MRTFNVRTFGCQMNKHDAERVVGLLQASGLEQVARPDDADVVVFMTCCVRENAEERLVGIVNSLRQTRENLPRRLIAVGGCMGQRDGERLLDRMPHLDVVFGTHNLSHLPALLETASHQQRPTVEVLESSGEFASELPGLREHAWHAWVPIAVGCDNFCTYCIVPFVRGPERSRAFEDIVNECEQLAADGVFEVTLLGQNVNSYGRDLYGDPRFAEVLVAVASTGLRRVRFATSHPKDLSDETIHAMASTPQVAKALHLPVQSGSDRVLAAMNRVYTRASYLALVDRLYEAMPGLALSTDIIVGFPGESAEDFERTLEVVERARFDQAFTFIYSPRAGTPAASLGNLPPRELVQQRFDRLVASVQRSALAKNRALLGTVQEVLIEGPSKRDECVLTGRSDGNKVVHAPTPAGTRPRAYAGRFADVRIEEAQTWFLSGALTPSVEGNDI